MTHYLAAYSKKAICGVWADPGKHAIAPTCPDCRRLIKEDDAAFEALQSAPFNPAMAVPFVPFDPCAGYKERTR